MRGLASLAVLATALAFGTTASGHPGHGPGHVGIEALSFTPETVRVVEGGPVVWSWNGEGGEQTRHSVTADPGQAESFDSDPGVAPTEIQHARGDYFTHTFSTPGTYTYQCKVHSAAMRGKVVVLEKFNSDPGPAPGGQKPPRLTAMSVAQGRECTRRRPCRRARAVLTVDLSAGAELVGRVQRRHPRRAATRRSRGWSSVRSFYFQARPGLSRRALPVAGLRPGGYRLLVRAYDRDGTRTDQAFARFSLR